MDRSNADAARVPTELTLARAAEVRDVLLAALGASDRLTLDLSAVAEADVAGLQLLCALHRSALAQGKPLEVAQGCRSQVLEALIDAAGFRRRRGCADGCLWGEVGGG
jgi:anti-anti-sigma regulatory factor